MKKKRTLLLLAVALIIVGVVGGTLAWLTDKSDEVKNTFSPSDINITLTESEDLDLKMIPGHTMAKDPKVTVEADSEANYLFVKLDKSANFDTYMTYAMADGWTQGNGTDIPANVYYRIVASNTSDQEFGVLAGDTVTVKDSVTKDDMNVLTTDTYPTLTVTAYATQLYKDNTTEFTAAEAWVNAQP